MLGDVMVLASGSETRQSIEGSVWSPKKHSDVGPTLAL